MVPPAITLDSAYNTATDSVERAARFATATDSVERAARFATATSQRRAALLVLVALSVASYLATATWTWAAELYKVSDGLITVTMVFATYEVVSRFVYHFWKRDEAFKERNWYALAFELVLLVVVACCFCFA